jgi:hypothetical protein
MTPLATWGLLSLACALVLLALFAFDGLTEELHARREDKRRDTAVFDTVAAAQADFARPRIPGQRTPGAVSETPVYDRLAVETFRRQLDDDSGWPL